MEMLERFFMLMSGHLYGYLFDRDLLDESILYPYQLWRSKKRAGW